MIHRRPLRRYRRSCMMAIARNAFARAVRDRSGPFRERIRPSGRAYRRGPRHRQRALEEAMA